MLQWNVDTVVFVYKKWGRPAENLHISLNYLARVVYAGQRKSLRSSGWMFFYFYIKVLQMCLMAFVSCLSGVSRSACAMRRSNIWSSSCRVRPWVLPLRPPPLHRRSPPSPATASSFRTECLVSPNNQFNFSTLTCVQEVSREKPLLPD